MAKRSSGSIANATLAECLNAPAVQDLARRVEQGEVLSMAGLAPAAQSFLTALLQCCLPRRFVVLVADNRRTQELFEQDVRTWLTLLSSRFAAVCPSTLFYPDWEVLPHESKLPHADVISERLETLSILSGTPHTARPVITNVTALLQRTFNPQALKNRTRNLRRADEIDPLELVAWLESQGYEAEAQVNSKGQLSLRGGILDVFPLTSPWPIRLEFFGNELDSLRYFDPVTQISREQAEQATLTPGGEMGILRQSVQAGATDAAGTLLDHLPPQTLWLLSEPELLAEHASEYSSKVQHDDPLFVRWEELMEAIRNRDQCLVALTARELEEVAETGMLDIDDGSTATQTFLPSPHENSDRSQRKGDPQRGFSPREFPLSDIADGGSEMAIGKSFPGVRKPSSSQCGRFSPAIQSLDVFRPQPSTRPPAEILEIQRREFFEQMHRWMRQGMRVHVICNNEGEQQRFREVWAEQGFLESDGTGKAFPALHVGPLSRGFLWETLKLVVVTDAEVFGRHKIQSPRRLKAAHAQTTRSALEIDFTDLEESDLVVHQHHGIGRYLGLETMPSGTSRHVKEKGPGPECLVIEYAPADPVQPPPKLYVPVSEAHLVSKYVGAGKVRPALNTLGGTRWRKTREQAEHAVRNIAAEMLAIQAVREAQPGHAFPSDTRWQQEFEGSFIYEETPDQLQAIRETKTDLERARPMDRLVCGDVGFGKTEVAIRAAFKAVMGGKQVALLVPTTVLAQQHYNTFSERMADYPIRVELLSRFRSRRRQQQVVRDLALGSVDIVVGTHRLVQSDILFKDLGLVVVDEEQRFGVLHKERLKQLRTTVDVLTLSATPIPRTLYLAICGARDMSTIQTPPQDRLPVETIVSPYDERLIRDAIQRELNRGGQVYFLHNRVMTIETIARKLESLVPQARIVVGHGQMHDDDLERVMTQFVNGEADILLSTTIIESGLDIPNANTIIIDRADRFGLSDLYQLRGRVGRYKHQAYAYLLIPRHAGLLTEARKRISAIRQYATLGSGFKVAMRDLEIRGAGNLLGAEQSGHITAVGFDLYCQLLKQSVSALKGEKVRARINVEVNLDFLQVGTGISTEETKIGSRRTARANASLPYTYIADSRHRIMLYRKLAECDSRAALKALEVELADRFGEPPQPAKHLLTLTDLKVIAAERKVTRIESEDDKLMLTRGGDFIQVEGRFPRLTRNSASARLREIRGLLLAL